MQIGQSSDKKLKFKQKNENNENEIDNIKSLSFAQINQNELDLKQKLEESNSFINQKFKAKLLSFVE
jgi:hypothetical protein